MEINLDEGMFMSMFIGGAIITTVAVGAALVITFMFTNRGTYMEVVRDRNGRIIQVIERNYLNPNGLILNTSQPPMPVITPPQSTGGAETYPMYVENI